MKRRSKRISFCLLIGVMMGLVSCAEQVELQPEPSSSPVDDFEGKTIQEVVIRYRGPMTVAELRLRNHIRMRAGMRFSRDLAESDIRTLYETGLVEDVRVLGELVEGQMRVFIEVKTRPPYGPIWLVGNTVFSDKRLAEVSGVRLEDLKDDEQFEQARRRIEEYYHRNEYREAKVTRRVWSGEAQESEDYVLVIDEGEKTAWRDGAEMKQKVRR